MAVGGRRCGHLTLLAALSVGAQDIPVACTVPDPTNPCAFSCDNGDTYSLEKIWQAQLGLGYTHIRSPDGQYDYYVGLCGGVQSLTCAAAPSGSQLQVALQTWGSPALPHFPSYTCATLGGASTQSCTTSKDGLTCRYSGGTGQRALELDFHCAKAAAPPSVAQLGSTLNYQAVFTDPSVCKSVPRTGMTGGGTFVLLFCLFSMFYCIGGSYYNMRMNGMTFSTDVIPQIDYWRQLPGLVRDGCAFSWVHTKAALEALQQQLSSGGGTKDDDSQYHSVSATQGMAAAQEHVVITNQK
jgi:hypothetical protein